MKIITLTTTLLAGCFSMSVHAGFEQFAPVTGEANVFYATSSGNPGDYWFFSTWGLADLQSITTDDRTFELAPNINAYNASDPDWSNGSGDGNAWMDMTTLFRANPILPNSTNATFNVTVDANDLDERYSVVAFVRVRDNSGEWPVVREDTVTLTTPGTYSLSVDIYPGNTSGFHTCDAGFTMSGLNANPTSDWGSMTVTATELSIGINDVIPPNPSPMTFETAPYAISDQAISMTATTAIDDFADVEYYFTCTAGGGNDSGWQSSTNYVDTGLAANTLYSYTVTARDTSNQNEGLASSAASATTPATDTTAPSPNPMTFSVAPEAGMTLVSMTATTATDVSGVEYYFACTFGGVGANDSGWQSSPVYVDTGLEPSSSYTYTVTARDLSAATNVTAASAAVSVTTSALEPWMVNSLTNYTGDTWQAMTAFDLNVDGLEYGSELDDPDSAITFDGSGATFGGLNTATYYTRNVLRTLAQDYDDGSFEAYATIVFNGNSDQAAFIGMGQGIVAPSVNGNWGVPDLALGGVQSVLGEIKTSLSSNPDHQGCAMLKIVDGGEDTKYETDPVPTVGTFRVKLTYDADLNEATIKVDTDYAGGAFVADLDLGTIDTSGSGGTNMFYGAPVRVYVGGGEGAVVRDLVIKSSLNEVVIGDVSLGGSGLVSGGGMELSWDGWAGQTYDVQYKSDLMNSAWTTDTSASDIYVTESGTTSATSTVSGAQVYYRVIAK
ncbi:hypothetical protein P4C99_02340 [Pontiellaceae bacterium B1224]|nr:hypothetical protein [Pontiellaceae bacterium B1224]